MAIFDSSQIHTLSSRRSSLASLPDPENIGVAVVGISFLLRLQAPRVIQQFAYSYIHFRLMAAIFIYQNTQTSHSIPIVSSCWPITKTSV